ncbi:MAG: sigma-70 family RNA polymerase sigma factor [Sulfurimonas sp.]|jgi:RNA polymerase sigma factor (sigma-70 family)
MSNEGNGVAEGSATKLAARLKGNQTVRRAGYKGTVQRTTPPTEAFVVKHSGMVHMFARRYATRFNMQHCLDDFIAAGYLAMLHAWSKFDESLEFKFSTYLGWWLKRYMCKFANENFSLVVKKPRTGDAPVIGTRRNDLELNRKVGEEQDVELIDLMPGDGLPVDWILSQHELKLLVGKVARSVPKNDRERVVVEERLLAMSPLTFEELSAKLDITKQGVALMESRLKSKIKERLTKNKQFQEMRG